MQKDNRTLKKYLSQYKLAKRNAHLTPLIPFISHTTIEDLIAIGCRFRATSPKLDRVMTSGFTIKKYHD